MLLPRLLIASLVVILTMTVCLVGCVEEIASPPPVKAQLKVLLPQTPEEIDHGWLTLDGEDESPRRMTWDGEFLASEPFTLLPGAHHFLVEAVDARELVLFRGSSEEIIPDNLLNYEIVIQMYEVNIVCTVFPDYLDFGGVTVGSTATQVFTISNSEISTDPLTGRVSWLCADFAVVDEIVSFSLPPGQSRDFTVEFRPLALGASECVISTGTRCLDVPVMGSGIGVASQISPSSLDFGPVQVGQTVSDSFVISNTGDVDLPLDVTEDCGEYAIVSGGGAATLKPGEDQTVVVEFHPTSPGTFDCTIATGPESADVPCTGEGMEAGLPDLVVTSLTYDPPNPTTADLVTVTVEIGNIGQFPSEQTSALEVQIPQIDLVRTFSVPVLSPGASEVFQFSTPLIVAQDYALIAVADIDEVIPESDETNNMTATTIPVGQAAEPECEVTPLVLDFGTVPVGSPAEENFTVSNIGLVDLTVDIPSGCGDFTVVYGGGINVLAPGEDLTVWVQFRPETAGYQSCTIETGSICQGVTCSGTGDPPPACEVSPTVLDFGDLVVGDSAELSFTITNTGGGVLSGVVSELCPEFYSVSGFGYFELPAGQSREVTLRYAPSFEGYHSCTVQTGTGLCEEVSCTGTASAAVCFDFDDGAGRQGWYLHHVLSYPSLRIFKDLADSTNFQSNWADNVNYPNAYGDDPIGEGQGSFWLDTVVDGLPILTYPPVGDEWWLAHIRSPDLDYYPAWQNAGGFSARIMDHLSWAGAGNCYFSIHFTVWDEDQLRERTWPDVFGSAISTDSWRYFSVNFNDYADELPANWRLRRVFVQVWGTIGDQYQGGVYLDEICPISTQKLEPPFGQKYGRWEGGEWESPTPPR